MPSRAFTSASDDEPVWVGHYGQWHRLVTAAQAGREFDSAEDRQGWEVIIPRRVCPKEIHRVRRCRRYWAGDFSPGAKGKPPFCTCKYCTAGRIRGGGG